jgi:hypothetical protein
MRKLLIAAVLLTAGAVIAQAAATKFTELQASTMTVTNTLSAKTIDGSLPIVDVAVTTPTVTGRLVRTSANVVYISTGTASVSQWSKVGAQ